MGPRLHGRLYGRLSGETKSTNRCCPVHGFSLPTDWLWKDINGDIQPYCPEPECDKKLVKVKPCPIHKDISFDKMIWKNDEPYCPGCHKSLLKR